MENVGWSFPTVEDIGCPKKNSHEVMVRNLKNEKKLKRNEETLHGFNNYKVMANLD
jgi:hypothetical protein